MFRSTWTVPSPAGAALLSFVCFSAGLAQTSVVTFHNDNSRSGQNTTETILTPQNVKSTSFGKLLNVTLDGKVDAQPLHVAALVVPGNGVHNAVFAATENDSVYAFDANTGHIFWHVSLLGSGETPSDDRNCGQITPEIGSTATPVIDRTAGTHGAIYVIGMSKDSSGNYYQRVHALDLTTGAELFGGPMLVQASYPGTGANSSNGKVIFDPKQYKARPGLLLLNGVVYTSWGSHCDINPYTGWLIGYDRLTLKQTSVFDLAPNGNEGALWNSGGGPAADSQGNIFVSVANGTFDTALNSKGFPSLADYGNAFVKLTVNNGTVTPADYWTMYDTTSESNGDVDLGSGGIMLLPDVKDASGNTYQLAVGAGKDGNLYVVNRNNMGKYDSTNDGTIYQQLTGALPGGIWGNPAYFNNYVYFGPQGGALYGFQIQNAKLVHSSTTSKTFSYPGISPSVSANGSSNGIVWGVEGGSTAVLHAFDPANLSTEYYNSDQAASNRDHFGAGNKFITATVASGQVFVGTTNSVAVFGLLPAATLPNGQYTIINQLSTLVLDDPAYSSSSGTQMIQYTNHNGTNQRWNFTAKGSGYYTIQNEASGLYLADPGGSTTGGTKLEQLAADGTNDQLWSLTISGSGYVIRNKASNLVIDDTNFSVSAGNGITLWQSFGNSNQTWLIQ